MTLRAWVLSSVLALSAVPAFAAVDDGVITAATKESERLFTAARDGGERPGYPELGGFIDRGFGSIAVDELSLEQVQRILNVNGIRYSKSLDGEIEKYLLKLGQAANVAGARAMILRLQSAPADAKPEEMTARVKAALAHPAIKEAVAKGFGGQVFAWTGQLPAESVAEIQPGLVGLKDSISAAAPPYFFLAGADMAMNIPDKLDAAGLRNFAPLREKLAAALREKLAGKLDESTHMSLQQALKQLTGAFANGTLLNGPAPEIHFIWYQDPAHPDVKVQTLSELHGKVVVLDFWATWCGPCVASFPKVKALANYYRGYDVAVVGITSPQGFVYNEKGRVEAKEPEKEFELTQQFIKDKNMTWPVAFSKQDVFNADYGVMGIPDMVVIDTQGVVRIVDLSEKAETLEQKVALIDKLLGEGKKTVPAIQMMMKKPAVKAE